jgi:integrase/recombinase XerD
VSVRERICHAAEAFVLAHAAPGAWSPGTAVKYRQTLTVLGRQLAGTDPAAAGDVTVLVTQPGASALEQAFALAFGALAPATRARHLSALRSALAWWAEVGWLDGNPTAGWARPTVPVDTTRARSGSLTAESPDFSEGPTSSPADQGGPWSQARYYPKQPIW